MDKEKIENQIRELIRKNPSDFIPVKELEENGFKRYVCKNCGKNFWSKVERSYCGDPECVGGYKFLDNPIVSENVSMKEIWQRFVKMFEGFGHKEVKRYPVVARWRDDIYFVEAAIDDFAPYVIDGITEPIENPLVIAQPCIRFNDTENVGLTGRHLTTFIMAEQAAFNTEKHKTYFDKEAWLYIYQWLKEGLKIPENEITFVEDAWAGAGYAGNSLEYFAGGLELGNQVYMRFRIINEKLEPIKVKTIDMGAGLERWAWVLNNSPTIYEATFPKSISTLKKELNVKLSDEEIKQIYKRLGLYDFYKEKPEIIIQNISKEFKKDIKEEIEKLVYIYSLVDHSRTLLLAIHDGTLPSNLGGGYNLRYLIRRLLTMKRVHKFKVDLIDVINLIKEDLDLFPELKDFDILEIIKLEEKKFEDLYSKNVEELDKAIKNGITKEDIKKLYQSFGIRREDILLRAKELGINVEIPELEKETVKKEIKEELKFDLPKTEELFYSEDKLEETAKILKIENNMVILDRTIFYPERGGQKADNGYIDEAFVYDVKYYNGVIVHFIQGKINKKEGEEVKLKVDKERREALKIHHSATHIIGGSARKILGEFANQAGAEKDVNEAHLDITFYRQLTDDEIKNIEDLANEIVRRNEKISATFMNRTEAEEKYGMQIYQGGVIGGKDIRIVKVDDFDVEACGGLHCENTGEIGLIKITNVRKIQDGVIRITFKAGKKALEYVRELEEKVKEIKEILNTENIVEESARIFENYKKYKKLFEKSEKELVKTLVGKEKLIKSELEDVASLYKEIDIKDSVIIGKRNAIAKNSEENQKIIKDNGFSKIINKGEYIIGVI
ncbi:MAG: alanine--tRNA ligase [Candidatus Rehaiarchaeum fermentans]|nr:alanine--tRNA ligase [Candidatus Rehaiarchaeum fermentans]